MFFEFLWFLWQLFDFEYERWIYEFFEDEVEDNDEEEVESRVGPLFVNAEVIQPALEYQKEEPLLLTYQPTEIDKGTLAANNILNARSVPEAFCYFLLIMLQYSAVTPELRLMATTRLLSRINNNKLLPTVLLYTILASLYGDELMRVGRRALDSPWYHRFSAPRDHLWWSLSYVQCQKIILPARLCLCTTHTTACLCYVLLLKALQMG